jgi:hypothetical protein
MLTFHIRLSCWTMKHFGIALIISQTLQYNWIVKTKMTDIKICLQIDVYESGRSET